MEQPQDFLDGGGEFHFTTAQFMQGAAFPPSKNRSHSQKYDRGRIWPLCDDVNC